jgi:Cdc6-like AAA superfamily ATPase
MEDFINSNPGLQSRFNRYIHFTDYTAEELYDIFCLQMKKNEYTISEEASNRLKMILADTLAHKGKDFGNARFVRNLFEKVIEHQANRLANEPNLTKELLAELREEDLNL